jgi:hypothetical protein
MGEKQPNIPPPTPSSGAPPSAPPATPSYAPSAPPKQYKVIPGGAVKEKGVALQGGEVVPGGAAKSGAAGGASPAPPEQDKVVPNPLVGGEAQGEGARDAGGNYPTQKQT